MEELAITLSWWVAYCDSLTDAGVSIEEVFTRTEITLATGGDFFPDLTKFRAMRALISKVAEAYQIRSAPEAQPFLRAISGKLNKTLYDPDGNILRNTTEALAAILGGADSLCLQPHNFLYNSSDEFGLHLAIQSYNVLRYEAHVMRVHDPAAGSYFIEDITRQLVENGWKLFLSFEEQGGFHRLLNAGLLHARFQERLTTLKHRVATQQKTIVGSNRYTNPLERITSSYDELPTRLAASFEKIRLLMDERVRQGHQRPIIPLWIQQELDTSQTGIVNQRVNYTKDLLTSLGIAYEEHSISMATDFAFLPSTKSGIAGAIFCGTNAFYQSTVVELCEQRKYNSQMLIAGGSQEVIERIRQVGGQVIGVGHDVVSAIEALIQTTNNEA